MLVYPYMMVANAVFGDEIPELMVHESAGLGQHLTPRLTVKGGPELLQQRSHLAQTFWLRIF
jgi:hypothetical protein